jgi:hypothetical protein
LSIKLNSEFGLRIERVVIYAYSSIFKSVVFTV